MKMLQSLSCHVRCNEDPQKVLFIYLFLSPTVQSRGRDFGSPSSTDYQGKSIKRSLKSEGLVKDFPTVLLETKERARELIIKWIFDSIEEDLPTQPPPVPI